MKNKIILMLSAGLLFLLLFGMTANSIEKQTAPNVVLSSLEVLEAFFENTEPGNVEVVIADADPGKISKDSITSTSLGSVIKVGARFGSSKPEGTYIFYLKPDTGGYENAMIYKGYMGGENELNGVDAYFYIPPHG